MSHSSMCGSLLVCFVRLRFTCVCFVRHRLHGYSASWVPSPQGKPTSQNCKYERVLELLAGKRDRHPLVQKSIRPVPNGWLWRETAFWKPCLRSKQRDPNPNKNSLIRKQCCKRRRMESLVRRSFPFLLRNDPQGLGPVRVPPLSASDCPRWPRGSQRPCSAAR